MSIGRRARLVALTASLLGGLMLAASAAGQNSVGSEADLDVAPVMLDGRTLFRVRGVSSLPARDRAELISQRIEEAAADPDFSPDEVQLVETPQMAQIAAGSRVFVRVFDADAELEQADRSALAIVQQQLIRAAIEDYRKHREPEYVKRGLITILIATAILVVGLGLFFWLTRRLGEAFSRRLQPKLVEIRVQSLQLVSGTQVWNTLVMLARGLRLIAVLLALYVYSEIALSQFPQTHAIGERLDSYLLGPLRAMGRGFVQELPSLLFLLVLFFVVRVVIRLLRLYFSAIGSGAVKLVNFAPEWAAPTYRLVRIGVIAFAIVVAYPHIPGSGSDAFKGLSIFFGVLLSIGSSSFVANSIAGYALVYRRLFAVGDRVRIGEAEGEILDMRMQVTRLRTTKNEEVIVPNSTILNTAVVNYSSLAASRGLILHTTVGIGYETPWRQVEGMLLMAAGRTGGLLADPPPFVLQKALGDFCVSYELNVHTADAHDMAEKYHALHASILDVFNEYGVQIMTPAYEGDPAEAKIVPKERWFEAPSRPSDGPETR